MSPWPDDPAEDPDDLGDEGPAGSPLPPDDRLWRHPSELFVGSPPSPPRSPRRSTTALLVVVAAAAGAITASLALTLGGAIDVGRGDPSRGDRTVETDPSDPWPTSAEAMATAVKGGIVNIEGTAQAGPSTLGVVVDAGTVVTATQALRGSTEVTLTRAGDRQEGSVIGTDPATGLAVINAGAIIDGDAVADEPVRSRPPEKPPEVGEVVIEVGRSGGPRPTAVTATADQASEGRATRWRLLATDRPTEQSRSGAALIDGQARLLGMCLATDDSEAGHAVPVDQIQSVVREVRRHGRVRQAWLGVSGTDSLTTPVGTRPAGTVATTPTSLSTRPSAPTRDMPASRGARIDEVDPASPAVGSLHPGDVVIGVDDQPVDSWSDLEGVIRTSRPNIRVTLTIRRGDHVRSELVELSVSPEDHAGA